MTNRRAKFATAVGLIATGALLAGSTASDTAGILGAPRMTAYRGTLHITQNNAVISNMAVTGEIIVNANNVTLMNVKVTATNDWWGLRVLDTAEGFSLVDSEIDGQGRTHNAINGQGTFLRNNLYGAENGINVTGPSLIQDNYIHGLLNRNGSPHYDGIQVDGGRDVQILHNTIINEHGQTSAVMLDNYFAGLSNITVDDNLLIGGGYTVYVDGTFHGGTVDDASIRITNNQVGGGHYGDYAFYNEKPVFHGNRGLDVPNPVNY